HVMPLLKNDHIYLFTDGYVDQFGGPSNKKFKYPAFRDLLLDIHSLPLKKQGQKVAETLELWKGKNMQVDDILVVGFKFQFGKE
ncbi:MAG TPA: SpoIIE family protein phosphatase, partial [Bacteroidales bacterium]